MRYVTTDAIHVDTSDNSAHRQPVYRGGTLRTALLASANSPVSAKDVKRYNLGYRRPAEAFNRQSCLR